MGIWVNRHWRSIVGAAALLVPAWQGIRSILSAWGDVDFVASKVRDPGAVGSIFAFFANPPTYMLIPLMLVGFLLVWLDLRRNIARHSLTAQVASAIPGTTSKDAREKLVQLAKKSGWGSPLHGSTAKVFDHYLAIYNEAGGHVALAIRQDDSNSVPYIYLNQNNKRGGPRYDPKTYPIEQFKQAEKDLLLRVKSGGYNLAASPIVQSAAD